MGIRQIRYCDISGTEHHVETHHLNIDQMRVEIDLAANEYRKLLALLRPYLDAGRIEASAPDLPARTGKSRRSTRPQGKRSALSPQQRNELRQWAEEKGLPVPPNNRFKRSVIDQWRAETADSDKPTRSHTAPPSDTLFETETTTTPAAATPESTHATPDEVVEQQAPSRRDRVSQVLLATPRTWLTVAEIADRTEQRSTDTAERNATSELLRRMAGHGEAERDDTSRPVRYRAVPDALQKYLPADETESVEGNR